jgi:hypothetical protein
MLISIDDGCSTVNSNYKLAIDIVMTVIYNVGIVENTKQSKEIKMSKKFDAVIEAIENADVWMGGAVVVEDDDGEFTAYPAAYMTDGSYTGSRNVAVDLSNGLEQSTGYSLTEGTPAQIAELLIG